MLADRKRQTQCTAQCSAAATTTGFVLATCYAVCVAEAEDVEVKQSFVCGCIALSLLRMRRLSSRACSSRQILAPANSRVGVVQCCTLVSRHAAAFPLRSAPDHAGKEMSQSKTETHRLLVELSSSCAAATVAAGTAVCS
jgi:hypothetical protein